MQCQSCGAQLRPGARFCNVCGARQPMAEPQPEQEAQAAEQSEGTRVKRPPRTPRADDTAGEQDSAAAEGRNVSTAQLPEPPGVGTALGGNGAGDTALESADGIASSQQAPARDEGEAATAETAHDLADEEHVETEERPDEPLVGSAGTAEQEMPALETLARPQALVDGLPWPLPKSLIVGGRYRVEEVVQTAPDVPGAENSYRVTDLQGYERCWSCGTTYSDAAPRDQFCRDCGADLLAGEYVMIERRSAPDEAADVAAAQQEAAPAAEMDARATQRSGEPATEAPPAEDAAESTPIDGQAAPDERRFTQGGRAYRVFAHVPELARFPLGARLTAAAATDVGRTRPGERNEDSAGIAQVNLVYESHVLPLALCVVADGLGGHATGQDASRLVVRTLTEYVLREAALPLLSLTTSAPPPDEALRQVLREGSAEAHAAVRAANAQSGVDMGSTLVAALVCGDVAHIINAGDSRAYVYEQGELRRITVDHSLVEQLVEAGNITPEERYTHPRRNQIYKSLGDEEMEELQPDIFVQQLAPGMRLLLCSDGLWEMVRDPDMARILAESASPQAACNALVQQANENGGEDNITAIVLEVSA